MKQNGPTPNDTITSSSRISGIRAAERESHEQIYTSVDLFQKGSWLEKPVKTVMGLLPLFDKLPSLNVLDLGCGIGRNAIPIAQHVKPRPIVIDCVDLLPIAIQKLQKNAAHYEVDSAINGIISTIEAFPIEANGYDFIFSVSSLEHVESEERFTEKLEEIRRGLRENGIVCLIVNSQVREYDPVSNEQLPPQFEVNLPTQSLLELLAKAFPWEVLTQTICPQRYSIPRGNKTVRLETNVVTFAARKASP